MVCYSFDLDLSYYDASSDMEILRLGIGNSSFSLDCVQIHYRRLYHPELITADKVCNSGNILAAVYFHYLRLGIDDTCIEFFKYLAMVLGGITVLSTKQICDCRLKTLPCS